MSSRTYWEDNYRFSDHRLSDDPEFWLFGLATGFLVDLGIQARPDIYGHPGHEDMPSANSIKDHTAREELDEVAKGLLSHTSVRAFRDWAEGCIILIDDMISGGRLLRPDQYGRIRSQVLFEKVAALDATNIPPETTISREPTHLLA